MKKNVASQVIGAQMVSATDGSAFTGSVTVYVTGDGGTQAVGSVSSGACTHEGNGFHTYAPAQAETNYTHVAFTFIGTGAIPATVQIYTTFPQTGDNFARLGAPVGASISADIAGVQSDTDNIQTRLPAALVSGRMDVSVGAMQNDVMTAAAAASDLTTELQSGLATSSALSSVASNVSLIKATTDKVDSTLEPATGSPNDYRFSLDALRYVPSMVRSELSTELSRIDASISSRASATNLATLTGYVDTEVASIKSVTDKLDTTLQAAGGSPGDYEFRADSLRNAPKDGPGIDAAGVRAAIGLASANLDTQLSTISGYIDTEVGSIKLVTDKLDTTLEAATGSPGDWRFSADALRKAPTGSGGGGGGISASDVWNEAVPAGYSAGTAGYVLGTLVTTLAAVKTKTDQLSFDSGNVLADVRAIDSAPVAVDTGTAGTVSFVSGAYVATAGGTVNANITQIDGENVVSDGNGRIRIDTTEIAAAVWDEAVSGHTSAGTFGKALDDADDRGARTVIRGTVGSSSTTTSIVTSAFSPSGAVADQFKGRIVIFDNDTATAALRGQATDITASSSASTPTLTVTALTTAPSSGDTFTVV